MLYVYMSMLSDLNTISGSLIRCHDGSNILTRRNQEYTSSQSTHKHRQ